MSQDGTSVPKAVGIVADDLTGAIDTAGVFAARGLRTMVSLQPQPPEARSTPAVLCYNTQTRNLAAPDTIGPVRLATRQLVRQGYPRLLKKIDSTLRGHVGPETTAMLDESGARYAFVAPAFPEMGRTQRDGLLYVGDVPLDQAQEGNDPFSELDSPSVVELLRRQTVLKVGLVHLSAVDSGEAAIEARTRALIGEGCTVVAFDAARAEHLASIEAVLSRSYPGGLLVGSAGLATAMAARAATGAHSRREPGPRRQATGPIVLVSGSLNAATLAQLERVRMLPGVRTVTMDAATILGSGAAQDITRRRVIDEASAALQRGQEVCLHWRPTPLGPAEVASGDGLLQSSRRLNLYLQELVAGLLKSASYGGLVLVGGDTAHSVLMGLRAKGIALETEILPGISMGIVTGGDADTKPVATKAGGFGDEDTLVRVIEYLRETGVERERRTGA